MPAHRPNIVFILSDQQRWDTVGCYGQRLPLTPNLDQLAAQGVRFEHAFTCQPVCGPARSCLQTGLYATQTTCHVNHRSLPEDMPTIAKALGSSGYETAYVGKWHLASDAQHNFDRKPIPPERRGGYRDYWMASDILEFSSHGYEGFFFDGQGNRVDWEGYRVDRTAGFAADYLQDYALRKPSGPDGNARPFLLFLSFIEPHHQNDLNRYIGPIGSKQRFARYDVPGDLQSAAGDWRTHYPDYLGCCWALDRSVGMLLQSLATLGLADDTLVFYTSDHGCHFRTRNSEYKRSCHDSSIRVPLIACGPGFAGGVTRHELVSLIDLPATILQAGEVDPLPGMTGRPLQQLLAGSGRAWPEEVFVQISESQVARAIRSHRWTYCVDAPDKDPVRDSASERYFEQYLYDLQADPHQRQNLVTQPALAQVRGELAQRLRARMEQAGEAPAVILPAAQRGAAR